jgi:hypothetical protein
MTLLANGDEVDSLTQLSAVVEGLPPAACPERPAECGTLAQHPCVAAVHQGASGDGRGRGAFPARPCTGPWPTWSRGARAPGRGRRPLGSGPSHAAREPGVRAERRAAHTTGTACATTRLCSGPFACQGAEPRQQVLQHFGKLDTEQEKNWQHTVHEHAKDKITRPIQFVRCCT